MRNVFVVSGLGADEKVFHKLVLPGYKLVHVKWVATDKKESMADYAKKLLPQITDTNPVLLGLSLGGMIVVEIAKLIPTTRIISLSSVVTFDEFPVYYKIAGKLKLNVILPVYALSQGNRFMYWLFGVFKSDDKAVLDAVLADLDKRFLTWALHAILNWKNDVVPIGLRRIHGTNDKVLPILSDVRYDVTIKEGSHLMLLDKDERVSQAILICLKTD